MTKLRLSSKYTLWYKRLFPVLSIGAPLAWAVIFYLFAEKTAPGAAIVMGLLIAIALASAVAISRKVAFEPVDEVWLEGETLLIRKGAKEARVSLRDVVKLAPSKRLNPRRLYVRFSQPQVFGESVAFILPGGKGRAALDELLVRLNQAHGAGAPEGGSTTGG